MARTYITCKPLIERDAYAGGAPCAYLIDVPSRTVTASFGRGLVVHIIAALHLSSSSSASVILIRICALSRVVHVFIKIPSQKERIVAYPSQATLTRSPCWRGWSND